MVLRRATAVAVLTGVGLLAGACTNTTKTASSTPTSTSSSTSSTSTTVATSSTTSGNSSGTVSTGTVSSGCPSDAAYCETFDGSAKDWPSKNTTDFYEGYDSYLGGSYRMGERTDATVTADAPVNASDISQDYSVQVDVDAELGQSFPADGEFGITCWEHPVSDGSTNTAFLFFINPTGASIDLWDSIEGKDHTLAQVPLQGVVNASGVNHLTATCIQGNNPQTQEVQAQLALSINGQKVVSVNYDKTTKQYAWDVGTDQSSLGLLVAGKGSDVFYKNFAVTSRCQPGGDFPCTDSGSSTSTTSP